MEKTDIMEMLEEEIKTKIEDLNSLDIGSEEYSESVEALTKLYKVRIEEYKTAIELEKETNNIMSRREQLAEQKKDRFVKICIAGIELIVPIIFYNKWMNKGFEFEEKGSITSFTFRSLLNRFRPTKK